MLASGHRAPPGRAALSAAAAAALLLLTSPPRAALAGDRIDAAEHFALAQSAEKRQDWQAAISEYQKAYKLSPHPSVLYNMALDYERLSKWRDAAQSFLRYLSGSPDAKDRDQVLARVEGLRQKPAWLSVHCSPSGGTVYLDGASRGSCPISLPIGGGHSYQVAVETDGTRTPVRQVQTEFGENLTVTFDLASQPGVLVVAANLEGAEVRLDGNLIGRTPFSGQVPSGAHQLVVSMPGYTSVQRQLAVPAEGSQQVQVQLEALSGTTPEPVGPPPARKFIITSGGGYVSRSTGGEGLYQLNIGIRSSGDHVEGDAVLGTFGGFGGAGLELRLYLATGGLRPFLRAAGEVGASGDGTAVALEGGGGLLLSASPVGGTFGIEYFAEVSAQARSSESDSGLFGGPAPDDSVVFPVLVGVSLRFGG